MGLLKYFIVFFLVSQTFAIETRVSRAFKREEIVPNILEEAPTRLLEIVFRTTKGVVRLGNVITDLLTKSLPSIISFDSDPRKYYTFITLHVPDVLSGESSIVCLITNILGINIRSGTTLAKYQAPDQEVGSGQPLYIYLMFSQSGLLNFNERPITKIIDRLNFSLKRFLRKYGLRLFAGNFNKAQNTTSSDEEEASSREEE